MLSPLPRSSARAERLLHVGSLLGMLAIIALVAFLLAREHTLAKAAATRMSSNLAQLIDNEVQRNAEQYDHALQGMIRALHTQGYSTLPIGLKRALLFGQALATPLQGDMLLIDASGTITSDSLAEPPRAANFSGWASFAYLRDRDDASLRISDPFRDSIGDLGWCISFSRRINDAQGHFQGVASGTMRLDYFSALFRSLNIGHDGSISLISDDGFVLAREPELASGQMMGQRYGAAKGMQPFLEHRTTGSFIQVSGLDGKERLYTYAQVGTLPLKVVVGVATAQVFGPWQRTAVMVSVATTALCLGIFGLTLLLGRELNKRQQAEHDLATLAMTDGLTGLANRRRLDLALHHAWLRAQRSRQSLAVLMIDVDHFKAFNHAHGHQGGDAALRRVARTIAGCVHRPDDLAARYGGEEFVVLLSQTDLNGALVIAEAIRAAVERCPPARAGLTSITVSIGVSAALAGPGQALDTLVSNADEALYRAKAEGRNHVVALETGLATGQKKTPA